MIPRRTFRKPRPSAAPLFILGGFVCAIAVGLVYWLGVLRPAAELARHERMLRNAEDARSELIRARAQMLEAERNRIHAILRGRAP